MNISQRQLALLTLGFQAVGGIIYVVLLLVTNGAMDHLLVAIAGTLLLTGMLIAYRLGWERVLHLSVVGTTLLVIYGVPEPFVTGVISLGLFIPPTLALCLLSPAWVFGSAVATYAGLLIRAEGQGVYSKPEVMVLTSIIIGCILLARFMTDAARHNAERSAHQADLARIRAEWQAQELSRQQEAIRFQAHLLNMVDQSVIATDITGTVTYWNRFAQQLYGWSAEEAVGRDLISMISPPEARPANESSLNKVRAGLHLSSEYPMRRRDGTIFPALVTTSPIYSAEGAVIGMVGVSADISARKQAEEEIRRQAARAQTLARVAARLNAQLEIDAVLQAVCEEVAIALQAPSAAVKLYVEQHDAFVCAGGFGLSPGFCESLRPLPLAVYNALTGPDSPVSVIRNLPECAGLPSAELYATLPATTLVSARLVFEGELIGILNVLTADDQREFSADDLALLQGIADQAALAIANARLFAEAERRLRQVQSLHLIDIAITSSMDLRITLNVFLDQVTMLLDVDAATVLLFEESTQTLDVVMGRGFSTGMPPRPALRPGEHGAGRAVMERQTIGFQDLAVSLEEQSWVRAVTGAPFRAYYAVPLIAKKQVKGVLEVFARTPLKPDAEWLSLLETLAGQGAIAVADAEQIRYLQRSRDELVLAYDATLEGWSRALDMRDHDTEGHTRRVTAMTLRLARAMGVDEAHMVHIRRGALLHDIGKMGIPDRILLKPGPLNAEEWIEMRKHPVYAYEWLAPINFLRPALDIPYCHHEKWDGSGYPRGLKGEQIPFSARIFAVVDVWDALCSDRPYQKAWPVERVYDYIRDQAGKHFDPEVVRVFLNDIAAGFVAVTEPEMREEHL